RRPVNSVRSERRARVRVTLRVRANVVIVRKLRDPVERVLGVNTAHNIGYDVDVRVRDLFMEQRVLVIGHELVADVDRFHRSTGAAVPTAQQTGETLAELGVERVNDGVERGVGPAEPHEHVERGLADARETRARSAGRFVAERNHAVENEEGQPAAHEHAHDDGQSLQKFGLPVDGGFERGVVLAREPVGPTTLRALCRALQRGDPPDLNLRDPVDPRVSDDHDRHGNIEADERGRDGVLPVQTRVAVVAGAAGVRLRGRLVPIQLDRDERNEDGQSPRHADHHERHALGHLALVAERAADGPVAVNADDAQVQDGRGGAHDVERHPDVAVRAERPEPGHLRHRLPRHHEHGHEQVRDRQRHDESVRNFGAQVAEPEHRGAHQDVPEQRPENQRAQQASGERAGEHPSRLGLGSAGH
ncbi:putative D1B dopamine receptor, partial [Triplophysa rosa]